MQSTLCTVPYLRIIFIYFFMVSHRLLAISPLEQAKREVAQAQELVTSRFDSKYARQQRELQEMANTIQLDPLFTELKSSVDHLHTDPTYQLYRVMMEVQDFITELGTYNTSIIRADLLTKINECLDRIKNYELFTSLRSTLKKQRVALLEVFEEKDLISSLTQILQYQQKDLFTSTADQRAKVIDLPAFKEMQDKQKAYLASPRVKKILSYIEKSQVLLNQEQAALLKDKRYQKALRTYEIVSFSSSLLPTKEKYIHPLKIMILQTQHDLFLIPLSELI